MLPKTGVVKISVSATDASGVAQIRVVVDGVVVQSCTGVGSCATGWNVTKVVVGTHTIQATATDASANHNTATSSVIVTK